MSIYTMVAGYELDALVAEKVMGCKIGKRSFKNVGEHAEWMEISCQCERGPGHRAVGGGLRPYSTEIAAAWEVAEKVSLFKNCRHLHETREKVQRGGEWVLSDWEWVVEQVFEPLDHNVILGRGATAPLAICRAAFQVAEELKAAEENA